MKLNVRVVVTVRQEQSSFIYVIIGTIYPVKHNVLNNTFILGRGPGDREDLLCARLGPVLNGDRGFDLVKYLHKLAFRIAPNIFKIDVFDRNLRI